MVQASKAEALLAVEFYNTTGERRSFEAFVVHMHLAWLYLLQAEFTKAGIDYRYREQDGRRFVRVDGEPKTWELAKCVRETWASENDPVRRNLEFFVGLRNKIEHRFQEAIGSAVAGHAQAMILNYEAELTDSFGPEEGLADRLRFPVFLTSLTPAGVDAIRHLRSKVPAGVTRFIKDFHDGLEQVVSSDPKFEFRVHLVPQVGPRSTSDLAINFVNLANLTPEDRETVERLGQAALVATKVRHEPVQYMNWHRPKDVVVKVAEAVPGFNMSWHIEAWKRHGVRPDSGASDPAATDPRYCVYDSAHGDWLYSDAWIKKLIVELAPPPAAAAPVTSRRLPATIPTSPVSAVPGSPAQTSGQLL